MFLGQVFIWFGTKCIPHVDLRQILCYRRLPLLPKFLQSTLQGVFRELRNPSIHAEAVDNIYPAHANALRKAGLAPPVLPTMGDLWRNQDEKVENEKERDVSKKKNINFHFCIAYSRYFFTSIHKVIDRLKK